MAANEVVEMICRIHDATDADASAEEWSSLASDLAYWSKGQSYAEVESVASALGTARAELEGPEPSIAVLLDTATLMLASWASATLRDEAEIVEESVVGSVVERVRSELASGPLRPAELVDRVSADRFQVSKAIRRLIESDEVEPVPDDPLEIDRRARRYRLREPATDPVEDLDHFFRETRSRDGFDTSLSACISRLGAPAFDHLAWQRQLRLLSLDTLPAVTLIPLHMGPNAHFAADDSQEAYDQAVREATRSEHDALYPPVHR